MIGGFRKPQRNLRTKVSAQYDDEDENKEEDKYSEQQSTKAVIQNAPGFQSLQNSTIKKQISINLSSAKPLGNKADLKNSNLTSKLSFAGNEEESAEEFTIRKSIESRKLVRRLEEEKRRKEIMAKIMKSEGLVVTDDNISVKSFNDSTTCTAQPSLSPKTLDKKDSSNSGEESDAATISIPDAQLIYAAKKRRERARLLGSAEDYIPLSRTKESRLIREEDGDSDEDRVEMKGLPSRGHPVLQRRREVREALEQKLEANQDDDDDEELKRWEDEQIMKGVRIPAAQQDAAFGPQPPPNIGLTLIPVQLDHWPTVTVQPMASVSCSVVPASICIPHSSATIELICQTIIERISSVEQVHRAHQLQLDKVIKDIHGAQNDICSLEQAGRDLEDRFCYYQDMKGYVQDLVECLNEKVPEILRAEKAVFQIWRRRSDFITKRRQQDVRDQDCEVSLKNTKNSNSNEDTTRPVRSMEREARRSRRRLKRQIAQGNNPVSHKEGMSTDDEELPPDIMQDRTEIHEVCKKCGELFTDVIEDFFDINAILSRFSRWKLSFPDSYREAYVGLSLVKVLKPLVLWSTLSWSPLEPGAANLIDLPWSSAVLMFGHQDGCVDLGDDDVRLFPRLVEHVLVPRAAAVLKSVWDPLSRKQTEHVVSCLRAFTHNNPQLSASSEHFRELFQSVQFRIQVCIDDDIFVPLYSKTLLENKSSPAWAFFTRQFWTCSKLLSNILLFDGLLSASVLQQLTLDGLLNRYIVVSLQQTPDLQECVERCRMIASILPKVWYREPVDAASFTLMSFPNIVCWLAKEIFHSALGYGQSERNRARSAIKKLLAILISLNLSDLAKAASTQTADL